MSSKKTMTAPELRAELARRGITKREFAASLGVSYSYCLKILQGRRGAETRRQQATTLLTNQPANLRGIT